MGNVMRTHGSNRMIKLSKKKLIDKITANEKAHVIAYGKAVIAYKKEALKQLAELTKQAKEGGLSIRLNLTTPVDNRKNYSKIRESFEWEIDEEVELTQQEFNEWVLDETEAARMAFLSNSAYL